MTTSYIKILAILVVLIFVALAPRHLQAQSTPTCDVDLSQASAWMTQAQAKASSGNTPGAMALLDQVSQALSGIKSRCGGTGPSTDLSEKFTEPHNIYTINYPKGWQTFTLPESSDSPSTQHAILLASDQAAFDMLSKNQPAPDAQGVVVYVGTAEQIVKEVGANSSDKTYSGLSAVTLLQTISTGQTPSTIKIGAPEKISPIGKYEVAEASFSYTDTKSSTMVAKGTLLIMQLSDNQFALLLSFATPSQSATVSALGRSMAATFTLSPAK